MRRASILRLGLLALIWGSSFLFIKVGLQGLGPVQIVLARLFFGAVVLAGVLLVRGTRFPRTPVTWGHLAVAAVFGNILPYFSFAWAEQYVASNVAGVLNATTPLFTMVLALAATSERRASPARVLGLIVGFAGVVVILAPWELLTAGGSWQGQLACLAAAFSYGISYIYISRFLTGRGLSSPVLAAGQLAAATVLLGVTAPLTATAPIDPSWAVAGSMAALGVLGTGVAYLLLYRLIGDEGPTAASTVTYLIPIVAVFLGVVGLGEPLTWNLAAGTAVILAGVALTNRAPRHSPPATEAPQPVSGRAP